MADRDSEREKRVRELLSESKKKNNLGVLGQAQTEIRDIQSDLQNHMAMQQMQDQNRLAQTQTISQAAGMMMANEGVGAQVGQMNQPTQAVMAKYGVKPKVQQNTSRQVSQNRVVTKSGDTTNIKNETITNNNTRINVTQPPSPPQPVIPMKPAQPQQSNAGGIAKFQAWLSSMFAKQQNEVEIQKKEYRKKEWNLGRTTARLIKRIESATNDLGNKLDPKNMTSTLTGQLKWLFLLIGTTFIAKYWKPAMETIANIEGAFRMAFGLPMNSKLEGNAQKGISIVEKIGSYIGLKKGESLIGGIGSVFREGIGLLIDKIDFWFEERAAAIKSLEKPKVVKDRLGIPDIGPTLANISNYLGDLLTVAFGGSKGQSKVAANEVKSQAKNSLTNTSGKKTSAGDSGLISGSGRDYMRKSDFDALGNLKGNANSTQAMSRSLISLFDDKSNTKHTAEVATGLGQLLRVADRKGSVVIDPSLLSYLGFTPSEISGMQQNGQLVQKNFRIIGVKPTSDAQKAEMGAYTGNWGNTIGGGIGQFVGGVGGGIGGGVLGSYIPFGGTAIGAITGMTAGSTAGKALGHGIGASIDQWISSWTTKGLYPKLVEAESKEVGDDGSPGIPKMLWSLTGEGARAVKARISSGDKDFGTFDVENKKFYKFVDDTIERKKRSAGINGTLKESINTNKLQTSWANQDEWEQAKENRFNSPEYRESHSHIYAAQESVSSGIDSARTWISDTLDSGAQKISNGGSRHLYKGDQQKRVNFAMNYLIQNGFSKAQAAGIVGNLVCEGLFEANLGREHMDGKPYRDDGSLNPNYGPSAGIAQFHNGRDGTGELNNLKTWAKQHGKQWDTLETQLDYLVHGSTDARRTINKILNLDGPPDEVARDSAYLWGTGYERFQYHNTTKGIPEHNKRRNRAVNILEQFDPENADISTIDTSPGTIDNIRSTVGNLMESAANYVREEKTEPTSAFDNFYEKLSPTQQDEFLKYHNGRVDAARHNLESLSSLGFKTDTTGTYYQYQNYRGYVDPTKVSGLHGIKAEDFSFISAVGSDGKGLNTIGLSDETVETLKNAIALDLEALNTTYTGKGTENDYMMGSGGPIMFRLGLFTDYDSFPDPTKADFNNVHGVKYYVYVSKDRSRITRREISPGTPSVTSPQKFASIRNLRDQYNSRITKQNFYGPLIYQHGKQFLKYGTIKEDQKFTDWEPFYEFMTGGMHGGPARITPMAQQAESELLMILSLGKLSKSGNNFYDQNGNTLSDSQIKMATRFGIISDSIDAYGNRSLSLGAMSGDLNRAHGEADNILKTSEVNKGLTNYLNRLGLKENSSSSDIEKYYKEQPQSFTTIGDKIYSYDGIEWGTIKDGKPVLYDAKTLSSVNDSREKINANLETIRKNTSTIFDSMAGVHNVNNAVDLMATAGKIESSLGESDLKSIKDNRERYGLTKWISQSGFLSSPTGNRYTYNYDALYNEDGTVAKVKMTPTHLRNFFKGIFGESTAKEWELEAKDGIEEDSLDDMIKNLKERIDTIHVGKSGINFGIKTGHIREDDSSRFNDSLTRQLLKRNKRILSIDGSTITFEDNSTFDISGSKGWSFSEEDGNKFASQFNDTLQELQGNKKKYAQDKAYEGSDLKKHYDDLAKRIESGEITNAEYRKDGTVWIGDKQIGSWTETKTEDGKTTRTIQGADYDTAMSNAFRNMSHSVNVKRSILKRLFGAIEDNSGNLYLYDKKGMQRALLDPTQEINENTTAADLKRFIKRIEFRDSTGKWVNIKGSGGSRDMSRNRETGEWNKGTFASWNAFRGDEVMTQDAAYQKIIRELVEQSKGDEKEDVTSVLLENISNSLFDLNALEKDSLDSQSRAILEQHELRKQAIEQTGLQRKIMINTSPISEDDKKKRLGKVDVQMANDINSSQALAHKQLSGGKANLYEITDKNGVTHYFDISKKKNGVYESLDKTYRAKFTFTQKQASNNAVPNKKTETTPPQTQTTQQSPNISYTEHNGGNTYNTYETVNNYITGDESGFNFTEWVKLNSGAPRLPRS